MWGAIIMLGFFGLVGFMVSARAKNKRLAMQLDHQSKSRGERK